MKRIVVLFLLSMMSYGFAHITLPTANEVEIERYVGKWYAIAALPQFFTRKCEGQTAEYEIIGEEEISVLNTCLKKNGKKKTIEGKAVVVDKSTNARLEVTFNNFWTRLFKVKGEYVIIKLDPDYEYVLVGSSNRKSMWIMSREEQMPLEILEEYIDYATELGFETHKLKLSSF